MLVESAPRAMRRCKHTHWLGLCRQGDDAALLESDRLQSLVKHLPRPDTQRPSLIVLVGNKEKAAALRVLFGVKRARRLTLRRSPGEVHLHVDPSTAFDERPVLLADSDLLDQGVDGKPAPIDRCHETVRRPFGRSDAGISAADDLYARLLFPFADVFCFFAADLGGFRAVAHHLARWLDRGPSSGLPASTFPSIAIVTDAFPPSTEREEEAREAFLLMVQEETAEDPFKRVSTIDVIALFPSSTMSLEARCRRVKERLLERSDQVWKRREDTRTLFSAIHLAAFHRSASVRFCEPTGTLFDFVTASRAHNPVAVELDKHLSNFLKQITSPDQLTHFAAPMVASALFLDSYPPGAHGKRRPQGREERGCC